MLKISAPWWRGSSYDNPNPLGPFADYREQTDLFGPRGPALTPLWASGKTNPGWGGTEFLPRYMRGEFNPLKSLRRFERSGTAFALIMRSTKMVCLDIDGKNGGFDGAKHLGFLPPTVAETSKSGIGYHLFYLVPDTWDGTLGFARLSDSIGIAPGVDFRGTGCVFHHNFQWWNRAELAPLPDHLLNTLENKILQRRQKKETIAKTVELGGEEVMFMHQELLDNLAKPIPAGRRNNTLFAIGGQLKDSGYGQWQAAIQNRAVDVGLETAEIQKLITSIERYSA